MFLSTVSGRDVSQERLSLVNLESYYPIFQKLDDNMAQFWIKFAVKFELWIARNLIQICVWKLGFSVLFSVKVKRKISNVDFEIDFNNLTSCQLELVEHEYFIYFGWICSFHAHIWVVFLAIHNSNFAANLVENCSMLSSSFWKIGSRLFKFTKHKRSWETCLPETVLRNIDLLSVLEINI